MTTTEQWTKVKLGDVAREVRERCDDPASAGLERCVRGEDFESGETIVTRWGRVPEDMGPTFNKRFRPGHILYGTRRAYLRKGGRVDFDGVCANTTLVLESIPGRILPDLLPHILQSEPFVAYAVDASVGSTNPFTKWSSLREYEFTLPPLDRQQEIVEALTIAVSVVARADLGLTRCRHLMNALIAEAADAATTSVGLGDLVSLDKGISYAGTDLGEPDAAGHPVLNLKTVNRGGGWAPSGVKVWVGEAVDERHIGRGGELFIANTDLTRDAAVVGSPVVAPSSIEPFVFTLDLSRVRVIARDRVRQGFLAAYLRTPAARRHMKSSSFGSTVLHLNPRLALALKVPLPPLDDQDRLISLLESLHCLETKLVSHVGTNKSLLKSLRQAWTNP